MNRVASLFVAIPFLVYFMVLFGPRGLWPGMLNIALPMACIWFPDSMGALTGVGFGRPGGPVITKSSPGCLVRFAGWCLLLVVVGTKVYLLIAG